MTPSWIRLEPFDVLLFRDGRPFLLGGSNRARSLFPPLATTLQGAIRSRIMVDHRGDPRLTALLNADGYGGLRLLGPFPARRDGARDELLFPMPRDLHAQGGTAVPRAPASSVPEEIAIEFPSGTLRPLELGAPGEKAPRDLWVTPPSLQAYLSGDATPLVDHALSIPEPRTGIAVGAGGTVEDDGLFVVEYRRLLPDISLALRVAGVEGLLASSSTVRLGGEGRAAAYGPLGTDASDPVEALLASPDTKVTEAIRGTGRMKVYLASPALFCGGWEFHLGHAPAADCAFGGMGLEGEGTVTLVGAAVGKPILVSGWDLARGRPRATRSAVPPGSVYFFELEDDARSELPQRIHGRCVSCQMGELGFGLALVGTW